MPDAKHSAIANCYKKTLQAVGKMPVHPRAKFAVTRKIDSLKWIAKAVARKQFPTLLNAALVPSNAGYGHEYWLRRYSGYGKPIRAAIEHGLYFGDNVTTLMNPVHEEWQFGGFITFGAYRKSLLSAAYPNHLVKAIGPYIHYASTDKQFYGSIREKLIHGNSRTLTVLPAHSTGDDKQSFDHDALISSVKELARTADCPNLIACISPMDYSDSLVQLYASSGFIVVTAGTDALTFLAKQKALYELSDITVSNTLGTHIGYSLYMDTPHVILNPLDTDTDVRPAPGVDSHALARQKREFFETFANLGDVTAAQRKLVDYYWGGQENVLSPSELHSALEELHEHSVQFCKMGLWKQVPESAYASS